MNGDIVGRRLRQTEAGPNDNKSALDRAIETHYEDVRGAVRRRGLEPALATEVVHDLYLQLSRKSDGHAARSSWKGFLVRAAINLGIDRLRRRNFERRLFAALDGMAEEIPEPAVPMERRIDAVRRLDSLMSVIAGLPRQCRSVFIAYHLSGFSKDEVSTGLGMKRRMVDRHLRKALLHCMEQLPDDASHTDRAPIPFIEAGALAYQVAAE